MLSTELLLLIAPIIFCIALFGDPFWLLLAAVFIIVVPYGSWKLAGIAFDATDLVLVGFVVSWAVRGKRGFKASGQQIRFPFLLVALGIVLAIAYVSAPINQPHLTDPARALYQLYRYCWRPLILLPLALKLISTRERARAVVSTIVLAGAVCSLHAIFQEATGADPTGPFRGKNEMGGSMVMPFVLAVAGFLYPDSKRQWYFYSGAIVLIIRALLYAGSRGAMAAMIAGAAFFVAWLFLSRHGRGRLVRLSAYGLVMVIALFAVKPDVLSRPNVSKMLVIGNATSVSTFQWRRELRWPHFVEKIKQNPWLGVGTNKDYELGFSGNTPHNGYLSFAVIYGVPATCLFLAFTLSSMVNGLRGFGAAPDVETRVISLAIASATVGLLVHNIVETTFILPSIANVFWVLAGTAAVLGSVRHAARRRQLVRPRPRIGTEPMEIAGLES